ncbi:MAG TPA: nitroreductase/quinone reductase family protein [Candidatus Bathyarchaeia archaeon]|nr:nitroreductase/quinone reductase family protein [Candidatus Bathyarchaeia archaeon]
MSSQDLKKSRQEKLIHLTTRGRKTGRLHTVELWFSLNDGKVYLSHEGEETDWMKNIRADERVTFEIGGTRFNGKARHLEDLTEETETGKVALYEKYYGKASKEVIKDWFSLSKLVLIEPLNVA